MLSSMDGQVNESRGVVATTKRLLLKHPRYTQNAVSPLVRRYPTGQVSGRGASDARYLRHARMSSSVESHRRTGSKCLVPDLRHARQG